MGRGTPLPILHPLRGLRPLNPRGLWPLDEDDLLLRLFLGPDTISAHFCMWSAIYANPFWLLLTSKTSMASVSIRQEHVQRKMMTYTAGDQVPISGVISEEEIAAAAVINFIEEFYTRRNVS